MSSLVTDSCLGFFKSHSAFAAHPEVGAQVGSAMGKRPVVSSPPGIFIVKD